MSRPDADVLVVGAGPAGLTLALQAHDHGARVRVVERRPHAFRPSRALIVHPRTLEVLRPLGVTDAVMARGDPSPSIHVLLGGRRVAVTLGGLDISGTAFPHLLLVGQAAVEQVLTDALAARGIEVEYGTELLGVHAAGSGAVARLRRSRYDETLESRYVAGCDGAASTVRAATGAGWRGGPHRQEVVLADLELDGNLAPGTAHAVPGRDGVLFLFALGEQAPWRLLATRTAQSAGAPHGQQSGPVPRCQLQGLLDGAGLAAHVDAVAWSARIPLEHRIATRYRSGPLFVVGDAAHVHSPAGGQGMNTGIQDATNLGWKLAFAVAATRQRGPNLERLLDSYETERRPVAERVLAVTRAIFWAEAHTDPLASLLRGKIVPFAAPAVPFLVRRRRLMAEGVRILAQLDINYRRSVLSSEGGPPSRCGPRAGDRMPDCRVDIAGRQQRLHGVLARPGIHLLLGMLAPPTVLPAVDSRIHVWRIRNWPGTGTIGVRPDGYIGYRDTSRNEERLMSWLATVTARDEPRSLATGR